MDSGSTSSPQELLQIGILNRSYLHDRLKIAIGSKLHDRTPDTEHPDRINKYIEVNIMQISLQTIYENLEKIDRVDPTTSATYRQSAQEILADPTISLEWRKAISDRLNQVNHELTVHAHVDDDSY